MLNTMEATNADVKTNIRTFIVDSFLFGNDDPSLTDDASFLETGIIDSTGILELVSFVEQTYDIAIDDTEMLPVNLDSLERISAFVNRKRTGK